MNNLEDSIGLSEIEISEINNPKKDALTSRKNKSFIKKTGLLLAGLGLASSLVLFPAPVKALTEDFPNVSGPNPEWYLVENQPASVIIQKNDRTTLELIIGNTVAEINNSSYSLEAAPYIKEGRTMVPIRFISEGLGAQVSWNSIEKKVTVALEGKEIVLYINKNEGFINGEKISLEAPPEIKSGRTMVPVRLISEGLGADVSWNSYSKTVSISKGSLGIKTINGKSDADSDGLTFEVEKELGTNPNNKNSVYTSLTDGRLKELKQQYPSLDIFSRMPDGKGEVSLPMKLALELDPTEPHNFDPILDDYNAIRYAKTEGAEISKKGISDCVAQIIPKYGADAGNFLKIVLLDGKSTEKDIAPAQEKAKKTLSELYEKQLRKPSGQTLENFIASFSAEENNALILVSLGESTGMDAPLAQLIAYSGDLNLARNNPGLCEIIRTFGAMEDNGKKISEYEIFKPVLAQPGERWKFAFNLYNELLFQKVDITKCSLEEKKMFLSYVESRGALYESLADPKTAQGCTANQGFLAEITSRNFVAWQERVKIMTDAGVQVPKLSFLDMGLITNPVSIGYLENFRTDKGFSKPQKMDTGQINSIILEMYHDAMDTSGKNIIEFEKMHVGEKYPGYDNAKTDLFNPADIAITLDPTGFVEGKKEPYFGFFGMTTMLNATEGRFSNIAASNNADHEFSEEKIVKNPGRTIFLGNQPEQASYNFSTLFKYINWVNNVPVIEEYSLGEKMPTALALSEGSYKAIGQLKLEKLGLESNVGKYNYTGNYLYFNPYLLDRSDPFNFDNAGIVESHTKDDARTAVTSEYLGKLPK